MKIIMIFSVIVILKIAINTFRYLATKYYYMTFLESLSKPDTVDICRCISPIGNLFENAGTDRTVTVHINHNTYNTEISTQLNDRYFSKEITKIFEITLGVYSRRIREAVYPTYWLNLPLIVLEDCNLTIPRFLKVPIKVFCWVVSVVSAYYLEKFLDSDLMSEKIGEFLSIL